MGFRWTLLPLSFLHVPLEVQDHQYLYCGRAYVLFCRYCPRVFFLVLWSIVNLHCHLYILLFCIVLVSPFRVLAVYIDSLWFCVFLVLIGLGLDFDVWILGDGIISASKLKVLNWGLVWLVLQFGLVFFFFLWFWFFSFSNSVLFGIEPAAYAALFLPTCGWCFHAVFVCWQFHTAI